MSVAQGSPSHVTSPEPPSGPCPASRDVSPAGPTPRLPDRVRQALHTEVTQFRTSPPVERRVAASTQNQPLGGPLLFLHREVLQQHFRRLDDLVRASRAEPVHSWATATSPPR